MTGINLEYSEKNIQLIITRLAKLRKTQGEVDVPQAISRIHAKDASFIKDFVQCITTNTTHFFRESGHFDYLRDNLPQYISSHKRAEIRIWCPVSSTGEEPYTIAMVANEAKPSNVQIKMLATDIDERVIRHARAGTYQDQVVAKIPPTYRGKYFQKVSNDKSSAYRITQDMPKIKFSTFNLLNLPYPFEHKFDFIFCRNVFIYFTKETVLQIVSGMSKHLHTDGLLFLGHSEALMEIPSGLVKESGSIYRRA